MIGSLSVKLKRVLTAVVAAAVILAAGSAGAVTVTSLGLNKWYTISTPSAPIPPARLPAMLKKQVGFYKDYPYISVYQFLLTPGQKYTVQVEFPADYKIGSACLRGLNPLFKSDRYTHPAEVTPLAWCSHRGFPGGDIKGYIFGRYESFTVSPQSQHNRAWLVVYSKKPDTTWRIMMHSPAKPDDFVKKQGGYRIKPNGQTTHSWGQVRKDPFYLGYATGETPTGPTPQSANSGTDDVSGQWKVLNANGSERMTLDLTQEGADVSGWANYDRGRARVVGTVSPDSLTLKLIYEDVALLKKWLPPKVAEQVVGISAPLVFTLTPGQTEFQGALEPFRVWWNASKQVTRRADGGSPEAQRQSKPISLTLRRTAGPVAPPTQSGGQVNPPPAQPTGDEPPTTPGSYQDDKGNRVELKCGQKAFADRVIDYLMGDPAPIDAVRDPRAALGPADYDKAADRGYVTLGCGGSLTLYFSQAALTDVAGPDLYVFEIGTSVEPTKIEVSADGQNWIEVGRASGGTGAVDIGPYVQPGQQFRYVRLTDLRTACGKSKWPGADIDAVAVIGCVPQAAQPPATAQPATQPSPQPAADTAGPANLDEWIAFIRSGRMFQVVFDAVNGKFDDSNYTGDYRTDPMGTLKGGQTYDVVYANDQFTCTGFNQQAGARQAHTYGGVNPADALISLWGRVYTFDGLGRVWDLTYGIVGHLKAPPGGDDAWRKLIKKRPSNRERYLVKKNIPPGGGAVEVNLPGDPLNGLRIDIPPGSYPGARTFTITSRSMPRVSAGLPFLVVSPLIHVEQGGGYADHLLTLRVPVQAAEDEFVIPVYYDQATGRMEGMPVMAIQNGYVYAATRHFSEFFLAKIKKRLLDSIDTAGVDFKPGRDNWPFQNYGTYFAAGGICAGMTVSAQWYWTQRHKGDPFLYRLGDNHGRSFKTPSLQDDDDQGWKMATGVQLSHVGRVAEKTGMDEYFRIYNQLIQQGQWQWRQYWNSKTGQWDNMAVPPVDDLNWYGIIFNLKAFRRPVFVGIYHKNGGHAILAYGAAPKQGQLYVYDPNYDPKSKRVLEYSNGKFKPYESAANLKALQEGYVTQYPVITHFAQSAVVNTADLPALFADFKANRAGQGTFPAYSYQYLDTENNPAGQLKNGLQVLGDQLCVKINMLDPGPWILGLRAYRRSADGKITRLWEKRPVEGACAAIPLEPGQNMIGLALFGGLPKSDGKLRWEWLSFDWFRIDRGLLAVSPAEVKGVVGEPIGFSVKTEALPQRPRFTWTWGDGAVMGTGERTQAAHTWTKPGRYTVVVSLADETTDQEAARGTARVTIDSGGQAPGVTQPQPLSGCPEELLKWCQEQNFKPLKCLKCRGHVQPIGDKPQAFPQSFTGQGTVDIRAYTDLAPGKVAACSFSFPMTVILEKGSGSPPWPARLKIQGMACLDRQADLSPACMECPKSSLADVIQGTHDGKGRATFKRTGDNLTITATYSGQTISGQGGGTYKWGDEASPNDEAQTGISFKLSRSK